MKTTVLLSLFLLFLLQDVFLREKYINRIIFALFTLWWVRKEDQLFQISDLHVVRSRSPSRRMYTEKSCLTGLKAHVAWGPVRQPYAGGKVRDYEFDHRYQRHRRQILPPVSVVLLIPVAICHRYQRHRRQICHRCQRHRWQTMRLISGWGYLKVNLKAKIYIYVNSTIQRCSNKIIKIFLIEDFFNLPPVSATPVVNLELRISPRLLEKIRNGPNWDTLGLGGIWFIKRTRSKRSRDTGPLRIERWLEHWRGGWTEKRRRKTKTLAHPVVQTLLPANSIDYFYSCFRLS